MLKLQRSADQTPGKEGGEGGFGDVERGEGRGGEGGVAAQKIRRETRDPDRNHIGGPAPRRHDEKRGEHQRVRSPHRRHADRPARQADVDERDDEMRKADDEWARGERTLRAHRALLGHVEALIQHESPPV